MTGKKKTSLRTAWYGIIFLATVLPLVLLVPWVGNKAYTWMLDSSLELQMEEIQSVKGTIEHEIEHLFIQLSSKNDVLVEHLRLAAVNKDAIDYDLLSRSVDTFFVTSKSLHSITIFSREGHPLIHTDNPAFEEVTFPEGYQDHDFSELFSRPEFVVPMHGRNYFGTPYKSEGKVFFTITVPIGPKDAPLGVIRASVEVGGVWTEVERHIEDRGALIYLVDSRGSLLNASQRIGQPEGTLLTDFEIVRKLITRNGWNNGEVYLGLNGENVFGTGVLLERLAWAVVSEIPVKHISGPVLKTLIPLVVFVLILFLACAAFGLWLVSKVLRPIGELSSAFASVSDGDYSRKVDASSIEEIDSLASGFNNMMSTITRRKQELQCSEEALKKSETNLVKAQEVAHIGSWCFNLLENRLDWSGENFKIFGVPKGTKITHEKFLEAVHPEDREYVKNKWSAAIEGEPYDIEHRLLIDNEVKWVRRKAELSFNDYGEPVSAVGTTQDITERKRSEEELRESTANLSEAQEIAHIGHWKLDPETNEVTGSDEFFRIFGLTREEATLEAFVEVVHPEDRERDVAAITRGIEHGENWEIEHRLICRDGTEKFIHAVGKARTDESGKTVLLFGTSQDITERKRVEEALKVNEAKYRLIHNISFDGILVADTDSRIIECNRSAERIFGYDAAELDGRSLTELMPTDYRERHLSGVQHYCDTGQSVIHGQVVELEGVRKNGEVFPIELIVTSFDLDGKMVFTGTVRDITERKNSEESIKHLAYHDTLTGLPNRSLFKDRLDQVLRRQAWRQKSAAVLFLDLDRFKIINDTLGHSFGDELLKVVARRLEECLREGDTVARLGGDEFTIILQDLAKADDVTLVLEKILNTFKQPIEISGQEVVIGTSIGASVFPDDGYDSDTLIKNADTAMYRAKSEGKNNFQLYSTTMSTKANTLLKMEHRLRKAIENGRLMLHYQPQLDLRNDELVGMEALVRLADLDDGKLTSPGEFISVAEETGLIIPLSEWVLRTACMQSKVWYDTGHTLTVAVNISPVMFRQKNLLSMITDILEETGLNPKYLEIEITEETMLKDAEDTVEKMNALRDFGVSFAIDDFGTGYSSLSYIKMLPIKMLKIDRAFINDIFTSSDDKAIVKAIIQMAHNMDLEVLAEGVETRQQAKFLRSIGCDKLQGYLFSKPVPHDEFKDFLGRMSSLQGSIKEVL